MLDLQEMHGEASDFVIHEQEWFPGTSRLNHAGESHLRQIAARSAQVPFPIIVENASEENAELIEGCPPCEKLDEDRRNVVIAALTLMGVPGASQRVLIGPALSPGLTSMEGERAYNGALRGTGSGFGGNGSGGNGGFGAGGGGGFGGGGFGR
jgi:uncharacterized membrane protein YgcG